MKISKFISGLVLGLCLAFIIGANTKQSTIQEPGRYHMIIVSNSMQAYVYDAVTGQYKIVAYTKVKKGSSIKDLLAE